MNTKRIFILVTILVAVMGLLTVSLAIASDSSNPPEAALAGGQPISFSSRTGGFDVALVKDDGTNENNLVLRDPNTLVEYHALWLNWFDRAEATFPFQLERVEYLAATSNLVGMDIQILVYSDENGGALTDATLVYTEVVQVQTQAGINVYTLTNPVVFASETDIILGFSSIYADGGAPWPGNRFPYSMDTTAPQGESYLGWMSTTGAAVDVSNLASLNNFFEMTAIGFASNWQTRGYGNTIQLEPQIAISKSPASQTIVTGGNADFTITVTNTGDVALANVDVSDPLVPDCDNAIGALAISQTVSYACQDTGVAVSYTNVATVTSQLDTGAPGPSATASADVTVVPPTSVSLSNFGNGSTALSPIWVVALLVIAVGFGLVLRRKLTA